MRNIVFQYYQTYTKNREQLLEKDGKRPEWIDMGLAEGRAYANRIGVEHVFVDNNFKLKWNTGFLSGMNIVFDEAYDQYDNILMLDLDMIINTSDNIFEHAVEEKVGMCHEWNTPDIAMKFTRTWSRSLQTYFPGKRMPKPKHHPEYPVINLSGALQLWSKSARQKARKEFVSPGDFRKRFNHTEQPYLNTMLVGLDMYNELEPKWNVPPQAMDRISHDDCILHYGGPYRKNEMEEYYKENRK